MSRLPFPLRPLYALLWLAGSLPLQWSYRLGSLIGYLPLLLRGREARIATRNLELCFPALDRAALRRLRLQALQETSRTLLETLRLWTRPAARNLGWVVAVEGEDLLQRARAAGRGVIVAAPHLGNWELLNQYLATMGPLAIVYRPPQRATLEPLLQRGRGGDSVIQLRAEPGSVRGMLRHLRSGGMLGLLPDQRPKSGEGEWVPFFGVPALTMTLLPRLAQRSGAAVVFAFAERLPRGRGFRVRFLDAPPALREPDPVVAAAALNAGIERCARLSPAQYQWTYKRFPSRPDMTGHSAASSPSGIP
jgi:Kdo2-lipid IVA lauroyltransferase/acyltransferase